MSLQNALLCELLTRQAPAGSRPDTSAADAPADALLLAMHGVANDRLSEVARLCFAHPDLDVASLSQYCLFLGLTRNVNLAFRAFDILKSVAPFEGGVWADLAYLQAVCQRVTAASRSVAVHAVLTGRTPPQPSLPAAADQDAEPGAIRFMAGDVLMALPEEKEPT